MVKARKFNDRVALPERLVRAPFAPIGDGLGLIAAGDIVRVRDAERAPPCTSVRGGDVASTVLLLVLLPIQFVLDECLIVLI